VWMISPLNAPDLPVEIPIILAGPPVMVKAWELGHNFCHDVIIYIGSPGVNPYSINR